MSHMKSDQKQGSRKVAKTIQQESVNVSPQTVRRRLREQGAHYKHPYKAPTLSENNRIKRIDWSKRYQKHDWYRTVFTDEKIFYLGNETGRVWIVPGGDNVRKTKKARFKLHIWGGISYQGKTDLHEFQGRVTSQSYQKCLSSTFMKYWHKWTYDGQWWMQQDGAPPHTSKSTMDFLKRKKINIIDWPAQSPDLNPIENLWGWMQHELNKHDIRNRQQLRDKVFQIWKEIPQQQTCNLIESMNSRL